MGPPLKHDFSVNRLKALQKQTLLEQQNKSGVKASLHEIEKKRKRAQEIKRLKQHINQNPHLTNDFTHATLNVTVHHHHHYHCPPGFMNHPPTPHSMQHIITPHHGHALPLNSPSTFSTPPPMYHPPPPMYCPPPPQVTRSAPKSDDMSKRPTPYLDILTLKKS